MKCPKCLKEMTSVKVCSMEIANSITLYFCTNSTCEFCGILRVGDKRYE